MHHLDAEQKKHVHLIEESKSQNPNYCMVSFVFFSNCGTVSGILEDVHHVQLPTLPFFPWAGQPVLGGLGGASPSN
jgi:ATP adenylyltransferase/5',5'''-P-1,P-4-tetraphosphate phosphorylase II